MFVPVACVKCGKPFQVPEAVAGTNVNCPWCKESVPALPVVGLSPSDQSPVKPLGGKGVSVDAPLSLDEYERLIDEAVEFLRRTSACRVILFGPGGVNEDTRTDTAGTPELTSAVNQMVLRTSQRLGVAVVNASELMAGHDGSVFLPGSNVYSQRGHEVIAREVYSIIASEVMAVAPCVKAGLGQRYY